MVKQLQYDVEQALKDCLLDMAKLRKQMSKNLPAQAIPPLAEALVKLRNEALRLGDLYEKRWAEIRREDIEATEGPVGSESATETPCAGDPGRMETISPEKAEPDFKAGEGGGE